MPGRDPDPSLPFENHSEPAPDSAPWDDTELAGPVASGSSPRVAAGSQKSAPAASTVPPEQLPTIGFIGRYALKYEIGAGGLGRVYAAHDPLLSRLIAIKTLNVELAAEKRESFNAIFLNEARAAAGLSHPHIVTVFDAGLSEQGPYIAMELLRGRDLRQLRLEGWRPTPTQAALLIRRVADALGYAHSKGVIHRDIKPANIFMLSRTQPRVLDFGIARITRRKDGPGRGDVIGGSPHYMSPEQIRLAPIDKRCDVFSLGVVLYELLTDQRPFQGNSVPEITKAVLDHEPPRAHVVDPNVPRALSEIAARAMQKNPDDRFGSARALSRELRRWLEDNEAPKGDEAVPPATDPRRKWLMGALAGTFCLVAVGLISWAWGPSTTRPTAAAPARSQALAVPPGAVAPSASASSAPSSASTALALPSSPDAVSAALALPAPPDRVSAALALPPLPDPPPSSPAATAAEIASAILPDSAPAAPKTPPKTVRPVAAVTPPPKAVRPPEAPREFVKERRLREAPELREARPPASMASTPMATGVVRVAVSPWGVIEINGQAVGTSPPLNELNLPEGRHTITLRNDEYPPFSAVVNVTPGQPVNLKHRF